MMIDRIRPDDPSSAPAVMSSLFSSTKPIATAASPAYEFSSEMTVGMSAPPIGRISSTPKSERQQDDERERPRLVGIDRQVDAGADRDRQQPQVDDVLVRIGDRPRRHDLLQLARGHQAAGERQVAEDDLEHDRARAELASARRAGTRSCTSRCRRARRRGRRRRATAPSAAAPRSAAPTTAARRSRSRRARRSRSTRS